MNELYRLTGPFFIVALLASLLFDGVVPVKAQSSFTRIKKKNGKVVEGQIKGIVVQKGRPTEIDKAVRYAAKYKISDGFDIESIDENGVRARGYSTVIEASNSKPLDELHIIELAEKEREGLSFGALSNGTSYMMVTAKIGGDVEVATDKFQLLGEFRKQDGRLRIIPFLEVTTQDGVVKIHINEIVAFSRKSRRK